MIRLSVFGDFNCPFSALASVVLPNGYVSRGWGALDRLAEMSGGQRLLPPRSLEA